MKEKYTVYLPDGKKIFFQEGVDGVSGIYILDPRSVYGAAYITIHFEDGRFVSYQNVVVVTEGLIKKNIPDDENPF